VAVRTAIRRLVPQRCKPHGGCTMTTAWQYHALANNTWCAGVVGTLSLLLLVAGGWLCTQATGHWIVDTPIANPMSVYQAYKTSRKSWGINALGTVIVEVELQVTSACRIVHADWTCA